MVQDLTRTIYLNNGVGIIFHRFSTRIVAPQDSPDLNPLDYSIWNELSQSIHWSGVKTRRTFIEKLNRAVHKIRPEVVQESCASWISRLSRVSQNGGDYLSK
jgi:hypothetical protein